MGGAPGAAGPRRGRFDGDRRRGRGCLAGAGPPDRWAELCWEAERDGDEHDPQRDDYTFRLHGTFRSSSWAVIRAHLAPPDGARIEDSGSGADAPGLCQVIAIGGTPDPDQCHLLLGEVLGGDRTRSIVSWVCTRGCAIGATDRSIELRIAVSVPEGGRPSWKLFAEAGP